MRIISPLTILLFITPFFLKAQSTALLEDFETTPVTSVVNNNGYFWTGESGCTVANRGDAAIHNSSNVDFKASQNGGFFVALNPEDSCGGFNTATLVSDSFDFSGYDSLRFSMRYFMSDTIGWGTTNLKVDLMTSSSSFSIDTVFSDTSDWGSIDIRLPNSMTDDTTWFSIEMGGGEAVGVDDLRVYELSTTSLAPSEGEEKELRLRPNPFRKRVHFQNPYEHEGSVQVRVMDMTGRILRNKELRAERKLSMELADLQEGIYFLEVSNGKGQKQVQRIVKERP